MAEMHYGSTKRFQFYAILTLSDQCGRDRHLSLYFTYNDIHIDLWTHSIY